mmetsp:Transcript_28245/g.33481  ORF Transcript_28245/g.33481 Transcript_28245/m.33481 type:complete len:410 (-) Transcript_28245:222-1451(-)
MSNAPEFIAALLGFEPLIEECLDCLKVIPVKSVEVRDAFPPSGMFKISEIINQYATQEVKDEKAYSLLTKCCDVVYLLTVKTEPNKQGFVRKETGGLKSMYNLLKNCGENAQVVRSACLAIRSVCTFDDLRKDFAGAYDAAKAAVSLGFVVELLRIAKTMETEPEVLAAVYIALRAIACNDEAVQQICAGGGLTMAEGHLKTHQASASVVRQSAALLRNLAGNDSVKTSLCSVETLELLLTAVATHPTDAQLAEHVIATFAAMALRVPTNCDRILAMGGGKLLSGSMRRFPNIIALQRQSCLAVRNLVGRSPHLKEPLLEDDMEGLLRYAGTQSGSIDAAFAALRDLGCEVEMVTVDPITGEVRKGVQQFGEVKSNFKPVYDNDPDADSARSLAMAAAAQSPAQLGYKM